MTSSAHSPVIPPDWAERLLRATVRDADWRDAVTGDLREEFASLAASRGVAAARRWYCRQAVPLAARFAAGRIVPALTPPRRRLTVADIERTSSLGSGWSRELRHAWRALWQRPALTASIVCTLALALAANAVVFNLADALYLRPLRFADVDRLIVVASDAIGEKPYLDRESVTPADLRDWRQSITTATGLSAVEWWDPNLSGVDIPEQVAGFRVTPGFFETLGVQPILGRTFADAEGQPGADRAVILSHTFWTRRFNADPALLGRTIRLDGTPYEVVGRDAAALRAPLRRRRLGAAGLHRGPVVRSQEPEPDDLRPAGAGPQSRRGAGGMAHRGRAAGRRVPRDQQEPAGDRAVAHPRPGRRRHRPVPGDLAGGGRPGAAHRLRQHRQPAAGPRHRTAAGVRGAAGARRRPDAAGAAAADRGPVPGGARRRARGGARRPGDADHRALPAGQRDPLRARPRVPPARRHGPGDDGRAWARWPR